MYNFDFLDKMIDFHLQYKLPLEIKVFDTPERIIEKTNWLKNFGSSGLQPFKFNGMSDADEDFSMINYRGFTVIFIPIK